MSARLLEMTEEESAILPIQQALRIRDHNLTTKEITAYYDTQGPTPDASDTMVGYGYVKITLGRTTAKYARVLCRALSEVADVATTQAPGGQALRFYGTLDQLERVDAIKLAEKIEEIENRKPEPYRGGPGWSI